VRHRDRVIAALSHEVETRLRTIGRDGGLILGPTHHVQLDTPMENFWAMVETIQGRTIPAAADGPRR
jgi:uroporphyrinogen-III decarboxylase